MGIPAKLNAYSDSFQLVPQIDFVLPTLCEETANNESLSESRQGFRHQAIRVPATVSGRITGIT